MNRTYEQNNLGRTNSYTANNTYEQNIERIRTRHWNTERITEKTENLPVRWTDEIVSSKQSKTSAPRIDSKSRPTTRPTIRNHNQNGDKNN